MPELRLGHEPNERSTSPPSPTTHWSDVQPVAELLVEALLARLGAEPGVMPDFRTSTALRQLADLGHERPPSRWSWATARYEPGGRVRLPAVALAAVGFSPGDRLEVWGVCNRVALIVRPGGPGARLVIDAQGRLPLPAWLRRGPDRSLLIGLDPAAPVLVIAPAGVLDGFGPLLAGSAG